ncbi:MAG TPA: cyclic nucleotide-binding domain-containing protein [Polyangia bacterium]|nr:cyclic nucleotide-binding domain-containing protein [Polyangia bacterium]
MFADWLGRLAPVQEARSAEAREAIYRFRYHVYVEELGKRIAGADHQRRWIRDPEDEAPGTVLFYCGSPDEIVGTLRVETWQPGQVPPEVAARFSMHLFPGIDACATGEASRLMVERRLRGKLILPALARAAYRHTAEKMALLVFAYCAPGLVPGYRRLGYRPYPGDLIAGDDGLRVPLVNVTPDMRTYREVGAPVLSLAREYFGGQVALPIDLRPIYAVIESARPESDAEAAWTQIESDIKTEGRAAFLDGLPPAAMKKLLAKGYTLDVPPGQVVTRADLVEQEVFVIFDGDFEVSSAGRRLAVLTKGDVFGELALFLPTGRRTATIRSLTPGRVLMLRRKFLTELTKEDPELAAQLLFGLGRVMAQRMAGMIDVGRAG